TSEKQNRPDWRESGVRLIVSGYRIRLLISWYKKNGMKPQKSLFNIDPADRLQTDELLVLSHPGRPLTKAQKTFNRLVGEIERLRSGLNEQVRRLDAALSYYGEHLHPRLQRQNALRKDIIRALMPFLDGPNRLKHKR